MNANELAARLNGRFITDEITREEEYLAKQHGLVVVFGASDDLCKLCGFIHDEAGCYNGGPIEFTPNGLLEIDEEEMRILEKHGFSKAVKMNARKFEAVWGDDFESPSWTYKVPFPHITFDVIEDDGDGPRVYCRGFVFAMEDAFRDSESEVSK